MLVPSLSRASAKGWSGLKGSPQYNNPFPINDIQFLYSVKEAVDFISSKNWVEFSQRAGRAGEGSIAMSVRARCLKDGESID